MFSLERRNSGETSWFPLNMGRAVTWTKKSDLFHMTPESATSNHGRGHGETVVRAILRSQSGGDWRGCRCAVALTLRPLARVLEWLGL